MTNLLKAADAMAEAQKGILASLVAAVSLLRRSPKKAAPSDKMFDIMINDYERAIKAGREALSAYEAAKREAERVRHKKRGTSYVVASRTGKLQTARPLNDMDVLVTYVGTDGQWWHRPPDEFDDGRFEKEYFHD